MVILVDLGCDVGKCWIEFDVLRIGRCSFVSAWTGLGGVIEQKTEVIGEGIGSWHDFKLTCFCRVFLLCWLKNPKEKWITTTRKLL